MKNCPLSLALVLIGLFSVGCGGKGDRPELSEVTGTITLDGQPLGGVAVVFTPDDGRPARGKTDADGKYELTYIGQTLGAKLGHHRVEIASSEEGEEVEDDATAGEITDSVQASSKAGKLRIPARYNTKSVLEADVKPGQNVFDFKLESKPSA